MPSDGGVNHLCLPNALNNSEISGKNPDNTFNATIGDFNGCAISNKSIEVKQTYHNGIMYFDFRHLTRHTNFSFEFSLTV